MVGTYIICNTYSHKIRATLCIIVNKLYQLILHSICIVNNLLDYTLKDQISMMYFCKTKSLTVYITNLNNLLLCSVVLIFKCHMKEKNIYVYLEYYI